MTHALPPDAHNVDEHAVEDAVEDAVDGYFHVTSVRNRESILRHGLDPARMGAAPGIAGSRTPEADGIFVARGTWEADWFVGMNNTGGPVDVWAVGGVDPFRLEDNGTGYLDVPGTVAADRLTLVREDLPYGA